MLLNLKLTGASGGGTDFARELDLSAVKVWGEHPFPKPVSVTGHVSLQFDVYTLRYTADFEMAACCSRCLVPVTREYRHEFEHTVLEDTGDAADAEIIEAPGGELDLDELVVSDLLLDYSGVTLCREDCRGLCRKCGKNLNEGDCGCDLKEPDPRFDILRKLMDE